MACRHRKNVSHFIINNLNYSSRNKVKSPEYFSTSTPNFIKKILPSSISMPLYAA